jgi:hypothetical protein
MGFSAGGSLAWAASLESPSLAGLVEVTVPDADGLPRTVTLQVLSDGTVLREDASRGPQVIDRLPEDTMVSISTIGVGLQPASVGTDDPCNHGAVVIYRVCDDSGRAEQCSEVARWCKPVAAPDVLAREVLAELAAQAAIR